MSQHDRYISPFSTRYSSDEMQYIFSDDNKFRTWRRLWVALARAEMEQGLTTGSPWLSHCDAGSEYEIAISHGEGRFVAPQNVLDQLGANGQGATQ